MSPRISGPPYVEVLRGEAVESVHDIAACAVSSSAQAAFALGNVDVPVYLRSTAKPFIAAVAVMAGVIERFGLTQPEIAVMAASHEAESFHIETVRSILAKIGLDESALQCGPEPPYSDPIFNNCSGKHAGVLALSIAIGADPAGYRDPNGPAQQRILDFCAAISDQPRDTMPVAVDGCGIPVYATSLRRAALSYKRFAKLDFGDAIATNALRRVRDAMIAYPEYMSGSGEFDATLIHAFGGTLVCKGGAEGVLGIAHIERGIGLVLKVVDGNSRARPPAGIAVLRSLGLLSEGQRAILRRFAEPLVYNKAGSAVGVIRPIQNGHE